MKRNIFNIIFILVSSQIFAQSFPLKSSKWYYANNGGTQPPNSTLTIFEYVKDTLINDTLGRTVSNGLVFYTHNDSVFYYNTKQERFGLLYVFSANVGDTLEISMPPDLPTDNLSFKVVVQSVTEEIYFNDTLLKFTTDPIDPDFHFENNVYMTRLGTFKFLPTCGVTIPEGDYLKCYIDSSLYLNFSDIPCDSVVTITESIYTTNKISVFPNPSNNEISIQSDYNEIFMIQILDLAGNLIVNDAARFINQGKIGISLLPTGVYMIKVIFDNGVVFTDKILIK